MNMDNLTSGFLDALNEAQRQALGNDNQFIEPVHLMKAFLQQKDGSVVALLKMLGTDLTGFENDIDSQLSSPLPDIILQLCIGGMAVNLRLPYSQHIEVRSVYHKNLFHIFSITESAAAW